MRRLLRWLLAGTLGLVVLSIILFVVLYSYWSGDYQVANTVAQDSTIPHVSIDGVTLHSEVFGEKGKPVVIVLHGGPGGDYRYLLSLKALADEYRVVFYDQRGAGLSPRVPAEEVTLDNYIADVDRLVKLHGAGLPVRLIGHSWGGMLASAYIGRHPAKVLQAVLAEPGFLTPEAGTELFEKTNYMRPPMTLEVLSLGTKVWFQSLHVEGPDEQAQTDFLFQTLMELDVEGHPLRGYYCNGDLATAAAAQWRFGSVAQATLFQSAMDEEGKIHTSFVEGVKSFPRKVLFLAGSCNKVIGEDFQRRHVKLFPSAELVVIQDAGHTMFGEKPTETIAAVRAYFDEGPPPEEPPN